MYRKKSLRKQWIKNLSRAALKDVKSIPQDTVSIPKEQIKAAQEAAEAAEAEQQESEPIQQKLWMVWMQREEFRQQSLEKH